MFIPHRKHTYGPPRSVTGIDLFYHMKHIRVAKCSNVCFIFGFFSEGHHVLSDGRMIDEWCVGRVPVGPSSRCWLEACLEGMRRTMKDLSQDMRCPCLVLN
jgi:hypothetical protein